MSSNTSRLADPSLIDPSYFNNSLSTTLLAVNVEQGAGQINRDPVRWACFSIKGVLIFTGFICNLLALAVFIRSHMRKSTPGHYLLALTLFDLTYLVGELLYWLNTEVGEDYRPILGIDFFNKSQFWCSLITYIRYVGRFLSAWTVVFISCERVIVVVNPLKVSRISTPRTAKCFLFALIIIGLVLCSFTYFTLITDQKYYICKIDDAKKHLYKGFMWGVLYVGDFILPSMLVCIFTGIILITLPKARTVRKTLARGHKGIGNKEYQLTLVLLGVATAFVLLRLPYCLAYFFWRYLDHITPKPISDKTVFSFWAAKEITEVFSIMNYAINFVLYTLFGSAFRRELRLVCGCAPPETLNKPKTMLSSVNGSTMSLSTFKASPRPERVKASPRPDRAGPNMAYGSTITINRERSKALFL